MNKGKLIVYYGEGEGKTSAALGRAIRALGHNQKVMILQFMKGRETGEYKFLKKSDAKIKLCGPSVFLKRKKNFKIHSIKAKECLKETEKIIKEKKTDLLVLDEILYAIEFGLIKENELIKLIKERGKTNIILTGREASISFQRIADQVSKIVKIKHYFQKNKESIKGLDL